MKFFGRDYFLFLFFTSLVLGIKCWQVFQLFIHASYSDCMNYVLIYLKM